jgi:hypothetical protein
MGNYSSRQKNTDVWSNVIKNEQQLILQATRNYNLRIIQYNHLIHGSFYDYSQWCRNQFELECIPESCRYGENYTPQYDSWGNQIF